MPLTFQVPIFMFQSRQPPGTCDKDRLTRPVPGLSRDGFFLVKLQLVELAVEPGILEQCSMRTNVHDSAVSHHDDAVGLENR